MANHNDSPELRKFKCGQCGKAFKFKHHLKVRLDPIKQFAFAKCYKNCKGLIEVFVKESLKLLLQELG